jgi:hypothetical protein
MATRAADPPAIGDGATNLDLICCGYGLGRRKRPLYELSNHVEAKAAPNANMTIVDRCLVARSFQNFRRGRVRACPALGVTWMGPKKDEEGALRALG